MLSKREIDRIENLNLGTLGIEGGDKIMVSSIISKLKKAFADRNEKDFAQLHKEFYEYMYWCDKELEIAALLGSSEHIPDEAYDTFLATGAIDKQYLAVIAGNIFDKRPLKPREQIIYNTRKAEIDALVAKSRQGTATAHPTVRTQKPSSGASTNNSKTGGKIDYAKIDRSAFLKQAREAELNGFAAYGAISAMRGGDKRCEGNCSSVSLTGSWNVTVDGVVYGDIQLTASGYVKANALKGTAAIQGSWDIIISHILAGSKISIQGSGDFIGKNNYDTLMVTLQWRGDVKIKNNYGKIVLRSSAGGDFYLWDKILEAWLVFDGQQIYEENGTIYIEYVGPGNESNSLQAKKKTSDKTSAFVSWVSNILIGWVMDIDADVVIGDTTVSHFNIGGNSFRVQHFNTSWVSMINGNASFDGKSLDYYIKNGKSTFFGVLKEVCDRVGVNKTIQQNGVVLCDYIGDSCRAFKLTKAWLSTIVVIHDNGQIFYARN